MPGSDVIGTVACSVTASSMLGQLNPGIPLEEVRDCELKLVSITVS